MRRHFGVFSFLYNRFPIIFQVYYILKISIELPILIGHILWQNWVYPHPEITMKLKLEIGKFYLNHLGDRVQIVGYRQFLFIRRYVDRSGHKYNRWGKQFNGLRKSLWDLVAEAG